MNIKNNSNIKTFLINQNLKLNIQDHYIKILKQRCYYMRLKTTKIIVYTERGNNRELEYTS